MVATGASKCKFCPQRRRRNSPNRQNNALFLRLEGQTEQKRPTCSLKLPELLEVLVTQLRASRRPRGRTNEQSVSSERVLNVF